LLLAPTYCKARFKLGQVNLSVEHYFYPVPTYVNMEHWQLGGIALDPATLCATEHRQEQMLEGTLVCQWHL